MPPFVFCDHPFKQRLLRAFTNLMLQVAPQHLFYRLHYWTWVWSLQSGVQRSCSMLLRSPCTICWYLLFVGRGKSRLHDDFCSFHAMLVDSPQRTCSTILSCPHVRRPARLECVWHCDLLVLVHILSYDAFSSQFLSPSISFQDLSALGLRLMKHRELSGRQPERESGLGLEVWNREPEIANHSWLPILPWRWACQCLLLFQHRRAERVTVVIGWTGTNRIT